MDLISYFCTFHTFCIFHNETSELVNIYIHIIYLIQLFLGHVCSKVKIKEKLKLYVFINVQCLSIAKLIFTKHLNAKECMEY